MTMTLMIEPFEQKHLRNMLLFQQDLYTLNFPSTDFDVKFYSWILNMYMSTENTSFVVTHDEILIGFYIFDPSGYLLQIYIQENFRGHGLGKMIMKHFEDMLLSNGLSTAFLHVSMYNGPVFQLYLSLGYSLVRTEPNQHSYLLKKILS